jgi:hypothetical protein
LNNRQLRSKKQHNIKEQIMESEKEVCDGEQAANAPQIKHELEGDVFYDAVEDETRSVPAQKNDPPDPDAIEVVDEEQMPDTGNNC